MVSKAILRYVRLSPRKFRLVIPLVKGKKAEEAIAILMSVKKKASFYAIELLKSAIANAKVKVQGIDTSKLYISRMVADPGPMLKRFRAASMGRAGSIHKHTSHLTVELDIVKEQQETKIEEKKIKEVVKHEEGKVKTQKSKVKTAVKKPKAKAAAKK